MLPEDYSPMHTVDRDECYWCGDPAKYRFHLGGVLACVVCFPKAPAEFVAYEEVY